MRYFLGFLVVCAIMFFMLAYLRSMRLAIGTPLVMYVIARYLSYLYSKKENDANAYSSRTAALTGMFFLPILFLQAASS